MADRSTTAEDVIVLDGVRKEFGDFVAVERGRLRHRPGRVLLDARTVGLRQDDRCCKMIAGFEVPTRGKVLLEGVDVSDVPPYKRNVNTVFQQYALFPHMSIVDNVAFGLRVQEGRRAGEARRRALRDARRRPARRVRRPPLEPAVGRPAAARRPGPGAGQPAGRPAARRAARRPRPQAARGDADRAEAHPARGRASRSSSSPTTRARRSR